MNLVSPRDSLMNVGLLFRFGLVPGSVLYPTLYSVSAKVHCGVLLKLALLRSQILSAVFEVL